MCNHRPPLPLLSARVVGITYSCGCLTLLILISVCGSVWLQVVVVAHAGAVFPFQVADKIRVLTVGGHRRVIGRSAGSPSAGNWLLPLLLLLCRLLACCPLMSACHYRSCSFILTSTFLLISTVAKLKVCRIKI